MKNIDNYLKFYNLFSWLYIRYFKRCNVSLLTVYDSTQLSNEGGSWWDVLDGVMWIITIVAAIIGNGFLINYLKG